MIEEYFRSLEALIAQTRIVIAETVTYDKRSTTIGFIRGELFFLDGSRLHLREYISVQPTVDRYTYSYHYQAPDGSLIFRYDNTPHFPNLANFPHHKHVGDEMNVISVHAPELQVVLAEIQKIVLQAL